MKFNDLLILRLLLALLLALTLNSVAFAGDEEWRTVTPGDLAMKPVVDPDADAEAIFWEVRLDDGSSEKLTYNHYIRVKIFTERGRERFSKFDILFAKGKKVKMWRHELSNPMAQLSS